MNHWTYTRFELLRTFRTRRFVILSVGFPVVLYFMIAAPNRNETDLGGTGISAPLYFMVSLAAFGTMNAILSSGARIAGERQAFMTLSSSSRCASLTPGAIVLAG